MGTGGALGSGGPAGVLIAWTLIGVMLVSTHVDHPNHIVIVITLRSTLPKLLVRCALCTRSQAASTHWPFASWTPRLPLVSPGPPVHDFF